VARSSANASLLSWTPDASRTTCAKSSGTADAEMVRKELETIRETRVGVNQSGRRSAYRIASPVLNGDSQVMVAIAMAGPRSRMEERLEDMIQSLVKRRKCCRMAAPRSEPFSRRTRERN